MNFFQFLNSKVTAKLFPTLSYRISYLHNHHHWANLKNPYDLSEIWYKKAAEGYYMNYYLLSDKFRVREYIQQKGYAHILTPLLYYYDSPDNIDFEQLPNRFALKMNFGAGMNIICQDKRTFNRKEAQKLISTWFGISEYSYIEKHYSLIDKCLICEEFIDDGSGGFPIDYKFMCINGKVHCILACSGRESGHADYFPYSVNWEPLPEYYKESHRDFIPIQSPANLNYMIKVAEELAGDIDLVRIDLYSNGFRIWFGEITLTPAGCIFHRWSEKALRIMGELYRKGRNTKI